MGDAGTYSVVVSNLAGMTTNEALLMVVEVPVIVTQPTNQTLMEGGSATFLVEASGTPPLFYQWMFNGTNIDGALANTLTFTSVGWTNAGQYSVMVTNAHGGVVSTNAVLRVIVSPVLRIVPFDRPANIWNIEVTGAPGDVIELQSTSDFVTWSDSEPLTNAAGTVTYSVTNTLGAPRLFRARLLP